jgi:hypothetical protein
MLLCDGIELALGYKVYIHYHSVFRWGLERILAVTATRGGSLRRAKGSEGEDSSEGGELHLD